MEFQSLLKIIKEGYKIWIGLLIYGASFLFAFAIFFIAIREVSLLILIPGFFGSLINFFLSKKFPKRFPLWGGFFHPLFFIPPYSSFFMSIALFIFLGHFFIPSFQSIWQKSLIEAFPDVVEEMACLFIGGAVVISLIFIPPILLFYRITKKTEKITFQKVLPTVFLAMIIAYFVGILIDRADFQALAKKLIIFILGFVPIHWFYELFLGSIFPIKSILMLLKKLPKIK